MGGATCDNGLRVYSMYLLIGWCFVIAASLLLSGIWKHCRISIQDECLEMS